MKLIAFFRNVWWIFNYLEWCWYLVAKGDFSFSCVSFRRSNTWQIWIVILETEKKCSNDDILVWHTSNVHHIWLNQINAAIIINHLSRAHHKLPLSIHFCYSFPFYIWEKPRKTFPSTVCTMCCVHVVGSLYVEIHNFLFLFWVVGNSIISFFTKCICRISPRLLA